ncbi:CoA-binding protein [Candidatus Aerophobetes bacterium]|uniref:CoA-binding protein n=1 Tax=Aerophobetes bacterium TaxID=2030807 RepID=A0A662DKY2_UNCAE|nr:MAG: CoA-binding protein [Candidatus Aerophobetes bacterium]
MLDNFFTPESVAIVGVSLEKEKLGNQILKNMLQANFKGSIFPVNRKATASTYLNGLKVYPTLDAIPEKVELCIIVVPSKFVISIIEDCGKKKISAAAIITAGFKETGKEGAKLEDKLVKKAKKMGVRILGPNILGIINTHHNLNASFAPTYPPCGNIAFISQSGALGCAVLDQCHQEGVGLSKFISLGNKADLDEVDFISFLKDDPHTRVIMGYLEGIQRGREFIEVAKKVVEEKPVIMIKSGRSKAGRKAASSHTGALSGADEAYDVAFKEIGIIRAKTIAEAFEMVRGFSSQRLPRGRKVLLVTNAGGAGIMATDACEDYSIELASLSEETIKKLKEKLPPASSISNPLDILGDAEPDRFKFALENVLPDPNVDAILLLVTPQTTTKPEETAMVVKNLCKSSEKPLLSCFMGGKIINPAISILHEAKIPNYKDPDSAVKVLRSMIDYALRCKTEEKKIKTFSVEKSKAESILIKEKNEGHLEIGGAKALQVMNIYGIPTVKNYLVQTVEEAVRVAEQIAKPVVMKIESPAILHKSDIGAVKVGVISEEVPQVFHKIMENARKALQGKNEIDGISIQPMIKEGKEILIGAIYDRTFGHLIRFGMGGKYVELFRDFATRLVPLSPSKVEEMIRETKIASKLLQGFRDEPAYDIELVKESLLRLSQLVIDLPWIEEIEANPLVIWEKGGVVIDARIKIGKES